MSKEKTLILDKVQIEQKLNRIAREILERSYTEKEIVLVGVQGNGSEVARRLAAILSSISKLKVETHHIRLAKDNPLQGEINYDGDVKALKSKTVLLVDDVLNSGRTLIYAAKHLLDAEPRSLSTAVLIDRFHRRFPIRADFVGLSLSTNMKEHVEVVLGEEDGAFLIES